MSILVFILGLVYLECDCENRASPRYLKNRAFYSITVVAWSGFLCTTHDISKNRAFHSTAIGAWSVFLYAPEIVFRLTTVGAR